MRARWYDPATGRFTTPDPFPGFAALPQTQHPYVYAANNPVNLTDPSGEIIPLIALPLIIGGGAIVADWVVQVVGNMCDRDMSFWDAVYYKNLDVGEMLNVGVTAAAATVFVTAVVAPGVLYLGSLASWQVGIWLGGAGLWTASGWAFSGGNALNSALAQYST